MRRHRIADAALLSTAAGRAVLAIVLKGGAMGMFAATAAIGMSAIAIPGIAQAAPAAQSVIEGQDGWLFPGWERTDRVDRAGIDANIRLIREARDALSARHIALVVLVVPAKANFYKSRLPSNVQLSPDIQARYSTIIDGLVKAGIAAFDERPILQSVEHDKQTAFYRADYHWSAWAAEASADETAKLIRATTPLPANGSGTVLGEWTNDRRYGDLATNFMSPDDRKRIGRDIYTVRKTPESGGALLDATPPQVLVVGNSFVQPYLGYPQKLSEALGQPVGLTWNPGNIGPWTTLLDAVESPAFAQHRPKVVVWQFNEAQIENALDAPDSWDARGVITAATWRSRLNAALAK